MEEVTFLFFESVRGSIFLERLSFRYIESKTSNTQLAIDTNISYYAYFTSRFLLKDVIGSGR